ncbi:hypothetical protein H9I45_08200 [Polaribacter haliotis]|uniref:Lipoprotein n=1 Tax=Polaribacter haliotis TaxID=1888915 RepID=A0A7L8ABF8_9FLAO|nr:hypothetical protein [Polaribacter haliotis]QOD59358.1 hypothetical protein H9I45_08200 [Polaribacter haliotis]
MKKILILLIMLNFISCSKITPSGFWLNYETDFITEKQNDQGPFGGTLLINWIADNDYEFDIKKITELADKNDWKLIDSMNYKKADLRNMTDFGKPTINLPLKNFTPESKKADLKSEPFPRWIETNFKLYRFKTGWLIFEPGTNDSTNENGFLLISSDNKQMTVYHLWGE